eukprot:14781811-Heterocapsa_arctica.AAC.1
MEATRRGLRSGGGRGRGVEGATAGRSRERGQPRVSQVGRHRLPASRWVQGDPPTNARGAR